MSKDKTPTRKEWLAARQRLEESGPDTVENDRFHEANAEVAAIESRMPWWKKAIP